MGRNQVRLVWFLIGLFLVATLGDHLTTWACLSNPVPGWEVSEVNPVSAWLFSSFGLVPGLLLDGIVTIWVAVWVGYTKVFTVRFKVLYLLFVLACTLYAVNNNYHGMLEMGIL